MPDKDITPTVQEIGQTLVEITGMKEYLSDKDQAALLGFSATLIEIAKRTRVARDEQRARDALKGEIERTIPGGLRERLPIKKPLSFRKR